MLRILIILFFVIGLVSYLGVFSFQKIVAIAFANGTVNYYEGAKNAKPTSVMTIKSCTPGQMPFVPSFGGSIEINPPNARLDPSQRLRIVNGDTSSHSIGIAFTKYWEDMSPGGSLEISYQALPKSGTWGIICDGINLGDRAPTIVIPEL